MNAQPPPLPPSAPAPPPLPQPPPSTTRQRVPIERANALFDQAFLPLGLVGKRYLMKGRTYRGRVEGREVNAYINPVFFRGDQIGPSQYHGHDLSLYVEGDFRTRASLCSKGSVNHWVETRLIKLEPVPAPKLDASELCLYALDALWARNLVSAAHAHLLEIARQKGRRGMNGLRIYPAAINLTLRDNWEAYTPELVEENLRRILTLAGVVESLPPTTQPVTETRKERNMYHREFRVNWGCLGVGVALGFIVLMLITLVKLNT